MRYHIHKHSGFTEGQPENIGLSAPL